MDLTVSYCPTRRDLEDRGWNLTDRLAELSARLLMQIGGDHEKFLCVRQQCRQTREALHDAHRDLGQHREEHGC